MSTKHKPATPLPWHLGVKQAERIIYTQDGWAVANATVYHGHEDAEDCKRNAAYIAHAANAYPRLVEALRKLEAEANKVRVNMVNVKEGRALGESVNDAAALLRELGEDA